MSRTFNMVGGGGGKAVLAVAVINGTATSATATKSGVSVNLTYSGGIWSAELPSFGAWTVTITDGTHSNSATVNASTAGLYTVSIYMPDVPIGYTQLEYIEGAQAGTASGSVTNFFPVSANRITGEFSMPYGSTAQQANIICQAGNSSPIYLSLRQVLSSGTPVFRYISSTSNSYYVTGIPFTTSKCSYNFRNESITFNGVTYTISGGTRITSNSENTFGAYFAVNNTGSNIVRHYWLKAYNTEDTEVVLNMVPAKRNSDATLGMYDTVNDVFYAAYGPSTAGPAV